MDEAALHVGDDQIPLPMIEGTEGEKAVDIAKLRGATGIITLDPGYVNTGSCQSSITFIDGEKGILRYRGYPIEEVCASSDFLETAYLLIYGTLPNQEEYDGFYRDVMSRAEIDAGLLSLIRSFPLDAHPMSMLASAVVAMAAFYPEDTRTEAGARAATLNLLAKMPTIAAACYHHKTGSDLPAPEPSLSYAGNFLHLMFSGPGEKHPALEDDVTKALDTLLILHADHEQNCSTATVRIVGSSHASLFAAISGGICSLWGPLHGGANQKVLEMLTQIQKDGGDIAKYLKMAKSKVNPFRLMGFGHRVYKNFDPRAHIIKTYADQVLARLGIQDPMLGLAIKLEKAALADPYFKERKLYPNVDFFSGIIYKAIGIPVDMFTVMFSIGRLPGWIAQWRELMNDPALRIGRPRQIYQGETKRPFRSMVSRHR